MASLVVDVRCQGKIFFVKYNVGWRNYLFKFLKTNESEWERRRDVKSSSLVYSSNVNRLFRKQKNWATITNIAACNNKTKTFNKPSWAHSPNNTTELNKSDEYILNFFAPLLFHFKIYLYKKYKNIKMKECRETVLEY
jgi:hypothetical protein